MHMDSNEESVAVDTLYIQGATLKQ